MPDSCCASECEPGALYAECKSGHLDLFLYIRFPSKRLVSGLMVLRKSRDNFPAKPLYLVWIKTDMIEANLRQLKLIFSYLTVSIRGRTASVNQK